MSSQPPPAPRPTRTAPPRHAPIPSSSSSSQPSNQQQQQHQSQAPIRRLGLLPTPGGPRESLDSNQDPSYDSSGSFLGTLQSGRAAGSRLPSNILMGSNRTAAAATTASTSSNNLGPPPGTPVNMMAGPNSRNARGLPRGFDSPLAGHGNRLMGGIPTTPRSPAGLPQSDGSFSVVKDEDEANNSGLLDLAPNYAGILMIGKSSRGGGRTLGRASNSNISRNNNGGRVAYGSPLGLPSLMNNNDDFNDRSSALNSNQFDSKTRFEKSNSNPTVLNKGKRKARDDGNSTEEDEEEKDAENSIRETGSVIEHSLGGGENVDHQDTMEEEPVLDYDYAYHQFDLEGVDRAQMNLASRLRKWRQEAFGAHKYEMAIFWGDKVLAFETTSLAENDAYFLAQAYFSTHQYARAEQLLTTPLRHGTSRLGSSSSSDPINSATVDEAQATSSSDQVQLPQDEVAGMVAEEDIEGDGDALASALAATRASSVLPSSKFSQSTRASKNELKLLPGMNPISGSGSSGTARKRKERTFTVSGTGTGSSEGGESGAESGASGKGDEDSVDGNQQRQDSITGAEGYKIDSQMDGMEEESQYPIGFKKKSSSSSSRSRNGMQIDSDTDAGGEADVEDGPKSDPRSSDFASTKRNRSSPKIATQRDPNLVWAEQTREALEEVQEKEVLSPEGIILVNHSKAARYLAAQCQVRLGKYFEALDLLGGDEHWESNSSNPISERPAENDGLKLASSCAHLRGQIYLSLDNIPRARECFMSSLALDVKNYEAFSSLVDGELLGSEEQWEFVESLKFSAQAGEDPESKLQFEFIRLMYVARLPKTRSNRAMASSEARRRLAQEWGLSDNPDVLVSLAEDLYARLRYADAYTVTSRIMELALDHDAAMPIHIACMHHLPNLRPALFILAHRLTESDPENPNSWFAVGAWYSSAGRWAEARRYFRVLLQSYFICALMDLSFSKANLLDPRFGPAWIAFAHSFAMEGESDQAITAYSTAARKFQQSHLAKLFIGMEHLHQGNLSLARLFLDGSAEQEPDDPLCLSERGVVAYWKEELPDAIELFTRALQAAKDIQEPASAWTSTHLNLGFAYRKNKQENLARECFLRVIDLDPHRSAAYVGLGMCSHRQGNLVDAIGWYHEALSIDPRDPLATDLLDSALNEQVATSYSSLTDKLQSMGIKEKDDEAFELELPGQSSLSMVIEREGESEISQSQSQDMSISASKEGGIGDQSSKDASTSEMLVEESM